MNKVTIQNSRNRNQFYVDPWFATVKQPAVMKPNSFFKFDTGWSPQHPLLDDQIVRRHPLVYTIHINEYHLAHIWDDPEYNERCYAGDLFYRTRGAWKGGNNE